MTRKFTFRQNSPVNQIVELEGEDISRLVRSLSLNSEAGHLSEVTLELAVFEVETAAGDTRIHIAPGTEDLLVRLGWTPPQDGDAS